MILFGLLISALLAEPATERSLDAYGSLASYEALDCIEDWRQLCSPPATPWLNVALFAERVEVTPFFPGDDFLVFRIARRSPDALELEFDHCVGGGPDCDGVGKGATARLDLRPGGRAVWSGGSVDRILAGGALRARDRVRVELIRNAVYDERVGALERLHVPGGRCEALDGYVIVGGRPCINAPGKSSPALTEARGDDSCGVERIRVLPFRADEVGRDHAYDYLIAQGCAAVPCLVESIGSDKRMADPRQAPVFPGFRVGDTALFMAARITGRPYDASLPPEVRAQIAQEGVQAYFRYVDATSRRQAIRDDWRRWLAAHPQCR